MDRRPRLVSLAALFLLAFPALGLWWAAAQAPQEKPLIRVPVPEGAKPKAEPPDTPLSPEEQFALAAAWETTAIYEQALARPFDLVEFPGGKKRAVEPVPSWLGRKPKF